MQIGLAVEPVSSVADASSALSTHEWDKLGFVQLVARDLCTYMQSYAQVTPVGERLVLPVDVMERWQRRFEEKFRHDPNFLLRRAGDLSDRT